MKNNLFSAFLMSVCLLTLGLWNLLDFLSTEEYGVLSLDNRGKLSDIVATRSGDLLQGDIVTGRFTSKYTNLGILSVRFFNQNRDSDDILVFRFKESGSDGWLYVANYKTDQFLPHEHFSFGFPKIPNSDNKNYTFEIESLKGATGTGILVDKVNPVFVARSIFTKGELSSDKQNLIYFLRMKTLNIFGDKDIVLMTAVFLLPFAIYLLCLALRGVSFQPVLILGALLIYIDLFLLKQIVLFYYISPVILWFFLHRRYRFGSGIATLISSFFLLSLPVTLLFGHNLVSEKLSIWSYLFVFISITQQLKERKLKPSNIFTVSKLADNFMTVKIDQSSWIQKIPPLVYKVFSIIISTIFIYFSLGKMNEALTEFNAFYPTDYILRYTLNLVMPHIFLTLLLIFLFLRLRTKIKNIFTILLVIAYLFWYLSGKIAMKTIEFQTQPRIISISPNNVREVWTDIVVTGKNFRDIPFIGKIYIDDVEQGEYMVYWSDEKVIFRTSPNLTKSGIIRITPLDRPSSNGVPFVYDYK